MDSASTQYPPQEQPYHLPVQPVAELYPAREISQQIVDVQKYEPYSIAASIQSMFAEAEQQGFDETNYWESAYAAKEYPNDTDAFRMYMKEVYRELKQDGRVVALRNAADGGHKITTGMVEAVFRAYHGIVSRAAEKLRQTLSTEQLAKLKQAGRNNLDWSFRGLLLERLTQDEGAPTRYALEDLFLILNPKARKVQYMERQEILKSLRNTMSLGKVSKEQLHRDVQLARTFAHQDMAGEIITDDDLRSIETESN